MRNIQKTLWEATEEYVTYPGDAMDVVCVADLGSWLGHCQTYDNTVEFLHMAPSGAILKPQLPPSASRPPEPITQMLALLLDRLSDESNGVRHIADYLRKIGAMGTAIGRIMAWDSLPADKVPSHTLRLVWEDGDDGGAKMER